jgi:hypothetical protein
MLRAITRAGAFVLALTGLFGPGDASAAAAETISLVPIQAPTTMSFENRGGALDLLALPGMVASRGIATSRAVELSNLLRKREVQFGTELTQALLAELKAHGVEVELLEEAPFFPDDPTALDYAKLPPTASLVLSGNYDAVGFYSGRLTTQFRPRVNVTVYLVRRQGEQTLYSQSIYYGADASKPAEDMIPADAKFTFASYDDTMARPDDVVEAMRDGVHRIARQIAEQVAATKR